MKQTAVEWLEKRFYFSKCQLIDVDFEKAKGIEAKNINDKLDAIREVILQLHNNEEITGFAKRAYAQCLDIVEQFKSK